MTGHDTLHEALAAVQADLPAVAKSHTADTGRFSYDYASLADVNRAMLPVLANHGLTWMVLPNVDGHVVGRLTHTSGEHVEASWPLPSTTDPQALGSAVTYARRYLLAAVTGLVPDGDDDGQRAQTVRPEPAAEPTAQQLEQAAGIIDGLRDRDPAWWVQEVAPKRDRLVAYAAVSDERMERTLATLDERYRQWQEEQT